LAQDSDIALVVPPVEGSFQGELIYTSRVSLALIAESLINALSIYRGGSGKESQAAVLAAISGSIAE
jgi:DNA-binding MurR/RpiR family transcriptional regulator